MYFKGSLDNDKFLAALPYRTEPLRVLPEEHLKIPYRLEDFGAGEECGT